MSEDRTNLSTQEELMRRLKAIGADLWGGMASPGAPEDPKPEDLRFLSVYYEENMSLTATAKRLYLHKNTVQQRLLRIEKITGADPRRFRDAVLFYLALLSAGHAALIPDAD